MQASLSMRRLAAVTAIVFVVLLAFLAGRVRAGTDPAQVAKPVSSVATPAPQPGAAPVYPDGGPYEDPYGGSPPSDSDPPVTHAS